MPEVTVLLTTVSGPLVSPQASSLMALASDPLKIGVDSLSATALFRSSSEVPEPRKRTVRFVQSIWRAL
ncbi:hypothetical protein D3C85_1713200 [compost metagenome]